MVCYDITSLFTCIPTSEVMKCDYKTAHYPTETTSAQTAYVPCLTCASIVATLYMEKVENRCLSSFRGITPIDTGLGMWMTPWSQLKGQESKGNGILQRIQWCCGLQQQFHTGRWVAFSGLCGFVWFNTLLEYLRNSRIFNKLCVVLHFKPSNTLRQKLIYLKDKTPQRSIYSSECTDLYAGETKQLLHRHIAWHRKASSPGQGSAVQGHSSKDRNVQILDIEDSWFGVKDE